ncbi:hypothetical protein QNO07_06745 [Streptomyces sp. 549]|uniref:trypsin-like serine peptidase n=1 Tax=Streptomyces sp. 549 TaxID=3049076 RepID=UPI0024C27251|nr:trypsin-like peptidase domain-containing protein [Streptomyces sp. 549]MDK1473121.1 hypothetical protein [Streptomyces sp. 549]
MEQTRTLIAALASGVTALVLVGAATTAPASAPVAGTGGGIPDAQGEPWAGRTVRTVGKLVTDLGGGRMGICSGAIVDSPSGSVVATAAHCVRSPQYPGTPVRGWFSPAHDGSGTAAVVRTGWRVTSYHTPPGWDVARGLEQILPHDYAFVTVERKNGRTLAESYGANRVDFAAPAAALRVAPFGYPSSPPFDGESLSYCAGTAELLTRDSAHEANVGGLLLEPCRLTRGASGGPWLRDFDPVAGSGTVAGVTSVGSGDGRVLGRPFPPRQGRALLTRADTARTPAGADV